MNHRFWRAVVGALSCVLLQAALATSQPTDVFFSEYIEGSSNNKALEIYNGVGGLRNTDTYTQASPTPDADNQCGPGPAPVVEIFEIQVNGLAPPYAGAAVETDDDIVTAVGPDGFTIQTLAKWCLAPIGAVFPRHLDRSGRSPRSGEIPDPRDSITLSGPEYVAWSPSTSPPARRGRSCAGAEDHLKITVLTCCHH